MTKKNYNLVAGLITLVGIIGIIGVTGYLLSKPKPLTIQGEAEANEYRVSGKVPGRIEKLYVKEGDLVNKGDTVVLIDSPEIRAKLKQVRAVAAAATAQRNKAVNGARSEQIAGAYQLWETAKIQEEVLRKSYERTKNLYEKKVVSAQNYDEVSAKYKTAASQTEAAKSQYEMAVNGARKEDKAAAAALLEQAEGALQEIQSYMDELYLTAPADGVVSAIYPKTGELVGPGSPIMSITDLNDIWFTFNIREDYLHSMKTGDKLTLTIPALDGSEYVAAVNYIQVRESYATWRASKEIGEYDAKTFEVRAIPEKTIEGIRPGMTALVK